MKKEQKLKLQVSRYRSDDGEWSIRLQMIEREMQPPPDTGFRGVAFNIYLKAIPKLILRLQEEFQMINSRMARDEALRRPSQGPV